MDDHWRSYDDSRRWQEDSSQREEVYRRDSHRNEETLRQQRDWQDLRPIVQQQSVFDGSLLGKTVIWTFIVGMAAIFVKGFGLL